MEPKKKDVEFLEHFGVKGMKWGERNASLASGTPGSQHVSRSDKKAGQAQVRDLSSTAGKLIRESVRAETPAARKAAADKYKAEVYDRVRTKEFKKAYQDATHVGKGDMAVHVLLFGPFAGMTIKTAKQQNQSGIEHEIDASSAILREMRRP